MYNKRFHPLQELTGQSWLLLYIGALGAAAVLPLNIALFFFVIGFGAVVLLATFADFNQPIEQLPPGWSVFERGPCGHPVKYEYDGPKPEGATPTFFIPLTIQLETDGPYIPTCRRCSHVSDFAYMRYA